jgi:uncharacterized integral membrane protein
MQKTFIGILLMTVAVVFFALKNAQCVSIDFWFWNVDSNLSLVIVLSVTFGAVASFLLSLPHRAKKKKEIKERDDRIQFLENEIRHLNSQTENPSVNDDSDKL